MPQNHHYSTYLTWLGNTGSGTSSYSDYERRFRLSCRGKPDLTGSSDTAFRGDASLWNPEELLLASIASCHMLWILHLAADQGFCIKAYSDNPTAEMQVNPDGSGRFRKAVLQPKIDFQSFPTSTQIQSLHDAAHKHCFIANSLNFPIIIK